MKSIKPVYYKNMLYKAIKKGTFLSRPNRFIAHIDIDGKLEICHVKNTGRCRELLVPGAQVYVEPASGAARKTRFDLIAVQKGDMLINIDSTAPNTVFGEWVQQCGFFGEITRMKPECKFQNSRFDFYIEAENRKIFIEVKGVTLESGGIVRFPDAPTVRGTKHVKELCACLSEGYEAHIFFIAQMERATCFVPNHATDPLFAKALAEAAAAGVGVHCLSCAVTPDSLSVQTFVPVKI